jgi:hypothetical protein
MSDNDEEDAEEGEKEKEYVSFAGKHIRAVMYKLVPISDPMKAEVTAYVHGGGMEKDLRFAREVFGRTNTSGRKDFLDFWESPWVEEHVRETSKKRRLDSVQKASAARNYVRNASAQETQDLDKYMSSVDTLSRWQDQTNENDDVKTVSRMVQSFERVTVRTLMGAVKQGWAAGYGNARQNLVNMRATTEEEGITGVCHTIRRHDALFDLFAAAVAMEISWADATSGTRNTPIYMCRQIQDNKEGATKALVRALNSTTIEEADEIGIPLMRINGNMCVSSNGVLIMGKDSTDAVYVLDMLNGFNAQGRLDLTDVKTIHIMDTFSEKDEAAIQVAKEKEKEKEKRKLRSATVASRLIDAVM